MLKISTSVMGVAGLWAALASPAVAQEDRQDCDYRTDHREYCGPADACAMTCGGSDWVWHTDGKRYWRTEERTVPYRTPDTVTIQVAPGDRKEGDLQGFQYLGKRTERVYFREVPRPAPQVVRGHQCTWRMHYVGKTTWRERFCVEDGVEQPYAHYARHGEHVAKK